MSKFGWIIICCLAVASCYCPPHPRIASEHDWASYCARVPANCTAVEGAVGISTSAMVAASADSVPFLPWPPPEPSSMVDLTERVPVVGRYAEVARRLDGRLTQKGYDRLLYYEVPGGFAITTELERFVDSGQPAERGRFVEGKLGGWTGFRDYLISLLAGEQGRFRVFVFVVTDQAFTPGRFPATQTDVERWETSGGFSLPRDLAAERASRGTRIKLLIYEFLANRGRRGGVVQATNRVPSAKHLAWLGF